MQPEDETIVTDLSVKEGVKMIIQTNAVAALVSDPHPAADQAKNEERPTPNAELRRMKVEACRGMPRQMSRRSREM